MTSKLLQQEKLRGDGTATPPALEHISWDELDKRRYFVLGPTMFLAVRAAVYPSNLVKTRLQVQSKANPLYAGTFDAFRKIARQEGMKGLYKGFGASTANVLTGNVYISVYEMARKQFLTHTQVGPFNTLPWTMIITLHDGCPTHGNYHSLYANSLARRPRTLSVARARHSSRRRSSCRWTSCRSA